MSKSKKQTKIEIQESNVWETVFHYRFMMDHFNWNLNYLSDENWVEFNIEIKEF